MDVFNLKILEASIRDVSTCLSDNQKVELLLYAIKSLPFEGYVFSRTARHFPNLFFPPLAHRFHARILGALELSSRTGSSPVSRSPPLLLRLLQRLGS